MTHLQVLQTYVFWLSKGLSVRYDSPNPVTHWKRASERSKILQSTNWQAPGIVISPELLSNLSLTEGRERVLNCSLPQHGSPISLNFPQRKPVSIFVLLCACT